MELADVERVVTDGEHAITRSISGERNSCPLSSRSTTRMLGLQHPFDRLHPALDALRRQYEILFVDDGSADRSVALLCEQFARRPDTTRVIVLARNAGPAHGNSRRLRAYPR